MAKKMVIASGNMKPEVMIMTEDRPAILDNLPTSVRGFCFHDNDGEAFIVLNARHTREQNRRTYDHEKRHIDRGEMYEPTYNEYGGAGK
jgi:hypothetical protein